MARMPMELTRAKINSNAINHVRTSTNKGIESETKFADFAIMSPLRLLEEPMILSRRNLFD